VIQSSSTALVAIGMTFVLLAAGVDLSVGASMFVGAAIAGKLLLAGYPAALALIVMLVVGVALGALNALFVVRLRIIPFVVTLATLYAGRGLALWITRTRSMNLPESILDLGAVRLVDLGVAITPPFALLVAVAIAAQLVLTRTPYGRQLYAVGSDPEAARKAGIRVGWILASVYVSRGRAPPWGASCR